MSRKLRLVVVALAVLLALALLSVLLFRSGQSPTRPPLPNPNGYKDFVQAGQALTGDVSDYEKLSPDRLHALVATNAEALRLLRLGLSRPCAMPMDSVLTNASSLVDQLNAMKRLARLLCAEGRWLELYNRPAEAAQSYTQVIQFGNEVSRGGLLITRLVGIACENMGRQGLIGVAPKLSPADARRVIAQLEKIDASHVAWAETVQSETCYVRYQLRHYYNPLMHLVSWWNNRRTLAGAEGKHKMVVAQERLLTVEMALRCCQAEGRPVPVQLEGLVTNYLSRLPADPFTAQPLVYRAQGTNWLLYSVGSDGVDTGGKPASRSGTPLKGALLFNAP